MKLYRHTGSVVRAAVRRKLEVGGAALSRALTRRSPSRNSILISHETTLLSFPVDYERCDVSLHDPRLRLVAPVQHLVQCLQVA